MDLVMLKAVLHPLGYSSPVRPPVGTSSLSFTHSHTCFCSLLHTRASAKIFTGSVKAAALVKKQPCVLLRKCSQLLMLGVATDTPHKITQRK